MVKRLSSDKESAFFVSAFSALITQNQLTKVFRLATRTKVKGLSGYLREKRLAAGYTQMEAARHIGHSTPQYISNYERELCEPSIEMAMKLGELFGITRKDLYQVLTTLYAAHISEALKLKKPSARRR
jgi:DNA-binding XRE family transcriptional regulator